MPYQQLKRYERPPNFADFGEVNRREYYVALGRHRDSDTLTESNWRVLLKMLGGESETVLIIRDSHWAVGWVEAIYIHESDTARCEIADRQLQRLEDYPVLDEEDWSALQWDLACEYWQRASVRERVDWCQRYRVSVFAARRDEVPEPIEDGWKEGTI